MVVVSEIFHFLSETSPWVFSPLEAVGLRFTFNNFWGFVLSKPPKDFEGCFNYTLISFEERSQNTFGPTFSKYLIVFFVEVGVKSVFLCYNFPYSKWFSFCRSLLSFPSQCPYGRIGTLGQVHNWHGSCYGNLVEDTAWFVCFRIIFEDG